mmetsp:Transcript_51103/g.94566  ORF Transcript_51103/g.94566 Transcript_51103/m.94566 type:complete len:105 (+) Transcript_51103:1133-1447(+)
MDAGITSVLQHPIVGTEIDLLASMKEESVFEAHPGINVVRPVPSKDGELLVMSKRPLFASAVRHVAVGEASTADRCVARKVAEPQVVSKRRSLDMIVVSPRSGL